MVLVRALVLAAAAFALGACDREPPKPKVAPSPSATTPAGR
jgi:hypothetical protein